MVTHSVKTSLFLAGVLAAVHLNAQESNKPPSQKSKQAAETLLRNSAIVGKELQRAEEASRVSLAAPSLETGKANTGRRDPFRPFTLTVRSSVRRRENLSPLERYELGQLKLVGIVWNSKEPTAMVEDSAGLGYVVKVGTPIGAGEGTVKAIKQNEIVVEEFFIDLYGARKRREVNMRISAEKAE